MFEEFPAGSKTTITYGPHFHVETTHPRSGDVLDRGTFRRRDTADSYAECMGAQFERKHLPYVVFIETCNGSCPIYAGNNRS